MMYLKTFQYSLQQELTTNILGFWQTKTLDEVNGGFYGQISHDNVISETADKGSIMHARIMWTFAAAYRLIPNEAYLQMATRAYEYIKKYFIDQEYGGVYWMVDYKGAAINTKKQIYANAFVIYAFSEYYLATGDQEALDLAMDIFNKIEAHSFDKQQNGYLEAYSRDWVLLEDLRLSDKDANEKKTNNTHLHILEAYTTLYEASKNEVVGMQLRNLIELFLDKILDQKTYHFKLFFEEDWTLKSDEISYGHDIEGAWLLQLAAEVLGDQKLLDTVKAVAVKVAEVTLAEGIAADGAIVNEGNPAGITDTDRHWWPQVEAMVGFINAYENNEHQPFMAAAFGLWEYSLEYLINESGEWWWRVNEKNEPILSEDKVGPWKAPYHNGRACIEGIKRLKKLIAAKTKRKMVEAA